jgi:hypothetical protein
VVNSIRGQRGGVAYRGDCSTAVGGRPEGNGGRGRWPTARGTGRWYTATRCSWRRRGARRGTGGGATWWLDGGGTRRHSGGDGREEERLFTGGQAPFIAGRGGGRRAAQRRICGRRNGGGEPWAWQVGGGRSLRWSARSERRSVCEAVDRGPRSFVCFSIYPKSAQL